jgi:ubiquinone/menaquinone biosynthesis C-methylase UbiE
MAGTVAATVGTSFDQIAAQYDLLWSRTAIGEAQRRAVWDRIDPLFQPGSSVLDLGCGTGVDACHLVGRGVEVHAIDSAPEMVKIARSRRISAHCCRVEDLQEATNSFDGVLSNFGALNCVASLPCVSDVLARAVRPGAHLALCFLGRICAWEIAYYAVRGNLKKAFRRIRGYASSSLGVSVTYPSARTIESSFSPDFRLLGRYGLGFCVPPSYVSGLTKWELERLEFLDRKWAHRPLLRALCDHSLYIFRRL